MSAKTLKAWIEIQELPKHIVAQFPFLLGVVLAWYVTGDINWGIFFTAMAAVYFITNGTYISNEYFDYEDDRINTTRIGGEKQSVTSTGGTRVLAKGIIKRKHALIASIVCFILSIPLGLLLQFYFHTGIWTIPIGAVGIFVGWYYTAPPIRAAYNSLGELFMAVGFGLLVFLGYYIMAGFSWLPVLVMLPWALCTPALKILREFQDYEADVTTNKHNLVVRFGRVKMSIIYAAMVVIVFLLLIPVVVRAPSWWFLLLSLPVFMLGRSAIIMFTGKWQERKSLETAAVNGFLGYLALPVVLLLAFLIESSVS